MGIWTSTRISLRKCHSDWILWRSLHIASPIKHLHTRSRLREPSVPREPNSPNASESKVQQTVIELEGCGVKIFWPGMGRTRAGHAQEWSRSWAGREPDKIVIFRPSLKIGAGHEPVMGGTRPGQPPFPNTGPKTAPWGQEFPLVERLPGEAEQAARGP